MEERTLNANDRTPDMTRGLISLDDSATIKVMPWKNLPCWSVKEMPKPAFAVHCLTVTLGRPSVPFACSRASVEN